ncbi:MAG TPA: YCF48-related protein [Planctomycetota bacterium]
MRAASLVVLLSPLCAQEPVPASASPAPVVPAEAVATRKLPDALLLGACFPAPKVGIVVGGRRETDPAVVMRTEDDGATWIAARVPSQTARLYDVQFPTPQLGFACGLHGVLLRTTDAGSVWEAVPTPFGKAWFAAVQFLDAERGFLAGSYQGPLLACTRDGGKNWELSTLPVLSAELDLRDVHFVDASLGFACGNNGLLVRTEDGGKTWSKIPTGSTAWLRHLCFVDRQNGFVISGDGCLLATTDGGKSWQSRGRFGGKGNGVAFADTRRGLVATMEGALLRTENGGESFVLEQQGTAALTTIVPIGDAGWWVFGERGQAIRVPTSNSDR